MPHTLLLSLISALNIFFTCNNLLITRLNRLQKVVLFSIAVLCLLILFPLFRQATAFVVIALFIVFICFICKPKILNICLFLFGYGCLIMIDYGCMIASEKLFYLTPDMMIASYQLPFYITVSVLTFTFTRILGIFLRERLKLQQLDFSSPHFILIFIYLIVCTILFIVNFSYGEWVGYSSAVIRFNGFLFFTHFIITSIILIMIIRTLKKEMRTQKRIQEYESLMEYTKRIEKMHLEMRVFKHNYINILSSMAGYIENDDMDSLKNYFSRHILPAGDEIASTDTKLGQLMNIHIMELKSLLSSKIIFALNNGIDVDVETPDSIDAIPVDIIDLITVIGIYLNNAIEAAMESKERHISLALIKNKNQIIFHLQNTFPEGTVSLKKIYQTGYSTKGSGRGLGLSSAEHILKKYKNMVHSTKITEGMFVQILQIPV